MNTKIRSVLWLGILTACLLTGSPFDILAQNAPVTTIGTVINAVPNQQVIVPVTVTGFNDISSITLTIDYNYSEIQYKSLNLNPALVDAGDLIVGQIDLGGGKYRLNLFWIGGISGITLPNLSTIVDLTFTYLAGTASLKFFDSGQDCEYVRYISPNFTKLKDSPTSTYYINGSVSGSATTTKVLNITAFLEGLYAGGGTMNRASDELGPHWPAGVADHITVELHNATNYSDIVYSVPDVALNTNGTATVTIPATYSGSYYITLRHRNSIETTSATAISFAGSTITQSFITPAQIFGGNLQSMGGGVYAIYGGDVNQDGAVDFGDMIEVDNDSYNYIYGYLYTDVNGDGAVDFGDMIMIDNNNGNYIGSAHP